MKTSTFILLIIITIFSITSCGPGFFEHGKISPEAYDHTIPFDYRQGLIVVELTIDGNDYDFLFDSGAITIVSKEVATAMDLQTEFSSTFTDSQDKSFTIDFGHTDKLKIGDASFDNLGIGVADFNAINSFTCLNIDGIIGSNLMQKSIWQVDYETQELRLSNDINNFDIDANADKIKFSTNDKGEARINLEIEGLTEKGVEIDLGSTDGFNLAFNTYNKLKENKNLQTVDGFGYKSAGFTGYGEGTQTTTFVKSDQLVLNNKVFDGQLVSFNENTITNIGNDFLEHFKVVIDWNDKILYLTQISDTKSETENFGFKPIFKEGKPIVGFIYKVDNSPISDLEVSDEIVSINGLNTVGVSISDWCDIMEDINQSSDTSLEVSVMRDGAMISKVLPKLNVL